MGEMMKKTITDFKSKKFWAQCFIEFLGTLLLVYGMESTSNYNAPERSSLGVNTTIASSAVERGIAIGCITAGLYRVFAPASGAYMNPAVTLGATFNGDLCNLRGTAFAVFQYIGGMLGAGLAYLLTPDKRRVFFGAFPHEDVTVAQAFFLEFMFGFLLTLVYIAKDHTNTKRNITESAIIIGLTVISLYTIGHSYTGGVMNPARALAMPIVTGKWPSDSYIYWLSPYVGAGFAGAFYRLFFGKFIFMDDPNFVDCRDISLEAR